MGHARDDPDVVRPDRRLSGPSRRRRLDSGFVGHLAHIAIDWPITIAVTVAAMTGGWFGGKLVGRIPAATLRRGFGVLIVAMATLILLEELF